MASDHHPRFLPIPIHPPPNLRGQYPQQPIIKPFVQLFYILNKYFLMLGFSIPFIIYSKLRIIVILIF